jgi:hypothetical protein
VLLLGVAALVVVVASGSAAVATPAFAPVRCRSTCSDSRAPHVPDAAPTHTAPNSCMHDAGCGGGGALTSAGPVFVVATTSAAPELPPHVAVAHATAAPAPFSDALLASRLFRPPRSSFGL